MLQCVTSITELYVLCKQESQRDIIITGSKEQPTATEQGTAYKAHSQRIQNMKAKIYLTRGIVGVCLSTVHPDHEDWEYNHIEVIDATRPNTPQDTQITVIRNVLAFSGQLDVEWI